MNIKDIIWRIVIIISVVFMIWFALSYIDVLSKNLNGNVVLAKWSLFLLFGSPF